MVWRRYWVTQISSINGTIKMEIIKITCLVFSPTGGCLKIANSLKAFLSEYHVGIVNITKPSVRKQFLVIPKETDYLFIVFPVYADTLPDIVAEYLKKLIVKDIPVSIIAGYGNIYPGKALSNARTILEAKGNIICSACTIVTAHSYNGKGVKLAIGEPSPKKLDVFKQFAFESINKVERENQLDRCRINFPEGHIRLRSRAPQKLFPQLFIRQPKVINERCNQCKVCINMCPSGAIDESLAIDNKKCIRCTACVKYCKNDARRFETRTHLLQFILMIGVEGVIENKFYI
jgi:ferredoxin